jgi:PTS system mannitol-specific IIA component/PTS system ascorbate-specific IIA component
MKFLEKGFIQAQVEVSTPEEAIEAAGNILYRQNVVLKRYVEAMIDTFRTNGAYFVIAPHIAIPHARPEDGVKEASVSLVQLTKPIEFGHEQNDPVSLVFGLGAASNEEHLCLIRRLMNLLTNTSHTKKLIRAQSTNELENLIGGEKR